MKSGWHPNIYGLSYRTTRIFAHNIAGDNIEMPGLRHGYSGGYGKVPEKKLKKPLDLSTISSKLRLKARYYLRAITKFFSGEPGVPMTKLILLEQRYTPLNSRIGINKTDRKVERTRK